MKFKPTSQKIQRRLNDLIQRYDPLSSIVREIAQHGGVSYLVGGAVRDLFLDLSIKDLDIEVHKIPLNDLESLLKKYGFVNTVGKNFGVLRLEKLDIDWSVPRTDSSGRKPEVSTDPWMDINKAFERRDLTINAMGIDLISYELVDPFNGLYDLEHKMLRAPNPMLFLEDPLRFYRVMQFVARFDMQTDPQLTHLCSIMDISKVSHERIEQEYKKWLLKSEKPSRAISWLDLIGRLQEIMPEVAATKGVLQEPDWHPEGDVFEHSKQTLDAAAHLSYESDEQKLIMLYAALCHDLGKAVTSQIIKGRIRSHGHEIAGVGLAQNFLQRFMRNNIIIDSVKKLVRNHMAPPLFVKDDSKSGAYKRLAVRLAPDVTLAMLAKVSLADRQGRNPQRGQPLKAPEKVIEEFIKRAQEARVYTGIEKPILKGEDLMDLIAPGPLLGKLLKHAYELQLEHSITNKDVLKKMVLESHAALSKS